MTRLLHPALQGTTVVDDANVGVGSAMMLVCIDVAMGTGAGVVGMTIRAVC